MKRKSRRRRHQQLTDAGIDTRAHNNDGAAPECPQEASALIASCQASQLDPGVYQAQRALLSDLEKANAEQHDKAILQLTAGALALTVTFMEKIAPHPLPSTRPWLAGGWLALVLSMAAMVSSFLTGQRACRYQMELLDKEFGEGMRPSQRNKWSTITTWLNVFSFALFLVGVACILTFSWFNLPTVDEQPQSDATSGGSSVMSQSDKTPPRIPAQPDRLVQPPLPGHGAPPPSNPVAPARPAAPPPPPAKK